MALFTHCDRQSPDLISPFPPQTYDNEVTYIQDRIHVLDNEISRLTEERASLLRRWNELKSPASKDLPPELLSAIFRHACPPIDFRATPFELSNNAISHRPSPPNSNTSSRALPVVLGAVCSYWRQVAQSIPELWVTATLEVEASTTANRTHLLELYLQRSGALPFSVELDFTRQEKLNYYGLGAAWRVSSEEALRPIRDVLFSPSSSSKLTTLHLVSPPTEWLRLLPTALPKLEDLAVGWPIGPSLSEPKVKLDMTNSLYLRRVSIYNDYLRVVLPWEQITFLHLSHLSSKTCFETLFQCKSLKECEIIQPLPAGLVDLTGEPVVLKYLEYLQWSPKHTTPPHLQIIFFQRMTLPVLRKFRWCGGNELKVPGLRDASLEFLSRLSTTLTTLEIAGLTFSGARFSDLQDLFRVIPHLENLILNGISHVERLPLFLEVLGLPDSRLGTTQLFLPALQVLELRDDHVQAKHSSVDLPCLLIWMLRGRFLPYKDSSLCIKLDRKLDWPENYREDVRVLVRKGFCLELWEHNKLVDWI